MLQKLLISDKCRSLDFSKNPEKMYSTVLNIDNNNKCFLELQISIFEGFLKVLVTLKTGIMMLKIQL